MGPFRYRLGLFLAAGLLLFWSVYLFLHLPPVQNALLVREQRKLHLYSRKWQTAQEWLRHPQAQHWMSDRLIIEQRLRSLSSRPAYTELPEWLLVFVAFRRQGMSIAEVAALPNGSLLLAAALAAEADPPEWAKDWASPLQPRPRGSFRVGLVQERDFERIRDFSPQVADCLVYSLLRHDLSWNWERRLEVLALRSKALKGHDRVCLQTAMRVGEDLRQQLGADQPLKLHFTHPARTGSRLRLHLELLTRDYLRSLGYRIDLSRGKPLEMGLSLQLSRYEDLIVESRHSQPVQERIAHTSRGKYTQKTYYTTVTRSKTVVESQVKSALVPSLWLHCLDQDFALPPFGEMDQRDLERIEHLYRQASVSPEEWFHWDYNIRVRASAPWRYGLEDFRHLTY